MKLSLKALCLAISLMTIALGVLSWPITAYRTQARIAQWVESNGGHVDWQHDSILEIPKVTGVRLHSPDISTIEPLKDATYLEQLDLQGSGVTSLRPLTKLSRLRLLIAKDTPIRRVESTHLWLPTIESLYLSNTLLTELGGVEHCKNLWKLELSGTRIRSFDLPNNHSLPKLKHLDFLDSLVEQIDGLSNCPNLLTLDLSGSKVSDISAIGSCSKLDDLRLNNTAIIDFTPIEKLHSLAVFEANETGFSDGKLFENLRALEWIELSGTQMADLTWLNSHPKVLCLDISYSQVKNLTPLENIRHGWFILYGLNISKKQQLELQSSAPPEVSFEFEEE